jgi:UDPglucose 6-dehydrogenase
MKIAVLGLWHLGCVTAACLANAGHEVLGYDSDENIIQQLQVNKAPIFEPGLDDLLLNVNTAGRLSYSAKAEAISAAQIIWVCFDTPVDDNDIADVDGVLNKVKNILPQVQNDTLVIISSQLPVGTTRGLQVYCQENFPEKNLHFAYSPENLRLGKAIEVFTKPDRIVVGLQFESDKQKIQTMLAPFSPNIIWMSIESAEMTKHALNAFLATSVVFINELASVCERVGADAKEVECGLKTEERIGAKAYLRAGAAIGGGTLARDVNFLLQIANTEKLETPLFSSLLTSNQAHKQWSCRRVLDIFKNIRNKSIAVLGLTYKSGTDTLRRSTAVETCEWLKQQGAKVCAYDPAIKYLPSALRSIIDLKLTMEETLAGVDAIVIATEWQEFTALTAEKILSKVNQPIVLDASGFLMQALGSDARIHYYSVGRKA